MLAPFINQSQLTKSHPHYAPRSNIAWQLRQIKAAAGKIRTTFPNAPSSLFERCFRILLFLSHRQLQIRTMSRERDYELETLRNVDTGNGSSAPLVDEQSISSLPKSSWQGTRPVDEPDIHKSPLNGNTFEDKGKPSPLLTFPGSLKSKRSTSKSSRHLAFRYFALVHLPPVAITITLLSLYITQVRWVNPSTEALNGLQFAAKGHETLILVSLGDILLHQISYGLKRQEVGVPLGFLSSALNLAAPLRYLISRQLWAPTLQSGRTAQYRRASAALIMLISILCLGASPLSAIAMIPRQGWWKDHHFDPSYRYLFEYEPTQWIPHMEYRTTLDAESGPYLRDIIDPSAVPLHTLLKADYRAVGTVGPENQNISYSNFNQSEFSYIATADYGLPTIATSQLSFIAFGLGNASPRGINGITTRMSWITSSKRQVNGTGTQKSWKQPVVAVQCLGDTVYNGSLYFHFSGWQSEVMSTPFRVSLNLNDSSALADLHSSNSTDYRFIDLPASEEWLVSGNILFASTARIEEEDEPERHYTLCLIFARWAEADTWIELPHYSRPWSHFNPPVRFDSNSSDVIHMDGKWLEDISSFSNGSFFRSIADYCVADDRRDCQERFLGLHITDAISQAGNNVSWPNYFAGITPSDGATEDKVTYTRSYYTYAYRFESSHSIPLAFTFLLLHLLLVLIHLITILGSNDPWQGSDWDNFGDMLVLALASKPPDGANDPTRQTSRSELWKKTVTVDRDGEEFQYRIRLRDEKGY
ncbi:uncharacterized protein FTJAE_9075 [Fusarium tjaetaba]|uniref:Uncharacterized protein n=1 Tax=Fusarium tjaetaba TaxID=1567544 RepID=A0A8H5R6S8_9HYPO|nr:uncharacterized protein FTJAE_9075 [Fusarium tjaetaba]KAF5627807.1 hypothetical protein FTJAE_9075 [Fusarium tjaetaba]